MPVVAPAAAATKAAPEETLPAPTPRAILVVDDEAEIAALLAEMLEGAGHRVEIAADGAVALEMLERRGYDLILTDTKMPVLDGVEFYRARSEEHTSELQSQTNLVCRLLLEKKKPRPLSRRLSSIVA